MELEKIYRGMENGAETIQENFSVLADALYPIGSIFQSMVNSDPATLFGGSWERIKGKVLVGVDENDSDFTTGKVGGEKNHSHGLSKGYAKLQISGTTLAYNGFEVTPYVSNVRAENFTAVANRTNLGAGTALAGTTDLTNNLQPYKTVYMWVRVA